MNDFEITADEYRQIGEFSVEHGTADYGLSIACWI